GNGDSGVGGVVDNRESVIVTDGNVGAGVVAGAPLVRAGRHAEAVVGRAPVQLGGLSREQDEVRAAVDGRGCRQDADTVGGVVVQGDVEAVALAIVRRRPGGPCR